MVYDGSRRNAKMEGNKKWKRKRYSMMLTMSINQSHWNLNSHFAHTFVNVYKCECTWSFDIQMQAHAQKEIRILCAMNFRIVLPLILCLFNVKITMNILSFRIHIKFGVNVLFIFFIDIYTILIQFTLSSSCNFRFI